MDRPRYLNNPIGSVATLAKLLGESETGLSQLASNSSRLVLPNRPEVKRDGSLRYTYRVGAALKTVHRRIVDYIFYNVHYPVYIQGGVRSRDGTRDAITDANIHASNRIIISEDVSNFFPSISDSLVHEMWQYFFCFSPDVASVLVRLTTRQGFLYQGASTSSELATLLREKGYTYSRFVDDVTVSTNRSMSNSDKRRVIAMIYGMFMKKGCKPNRRKHKLYTLREPAMVHNLNVNAGRATLNKKERARIRAAVKECSLRFPGEGSREDYLDLFQSTRGRVARLKRLHPGEGARLMAQLLKVKPNAR